MPNSLRDFLDTTASAPLSIPALLFSLALTAILGLLLGWVYVRFGRTLANRHALARILPMLALTTCLIIMVVKSSIALSLGLVGALSIVRFRTPIKEPEELAFLFLAISIGLGLGANQWVATLIAVPLILVITIVISLTRGRRKEENLFLNIALGRTADTAEQSFRRITDTLAHHVDLADVRRMDVADEELQVTYFIHVRRNEDLIAAMDRLNRTFPGAVITFVEQQNFLGG
jgi:uncharacterized membrane protein YhiD involved in acid resistance